MTGIAGSFQSWGILVTELCLRAVSTNKKRIILQRSPELLHYPGKPCAVTWKGKTMSSADQTPAAEVPAFEPDAEVDIHKVIARLRADLQTVDEAIRSLESLSPEAPSRPSRVPSRPRPVTKVVDIRAKGRRSE